MPYGAIFGHQLLFFFGGGVGKPEGFVLGPSLSPDFAGHEKTLWSLFVRNEHSTTSASCCPL